MQAKHLTFEVCDNYQKQTYRNRTVIYDTNGALPLTVPVIYSQNNRQLYTDIRIATDENWQDLHWKSIQSAYSSSPFFEFYEHDIHVLFSAKFENLMAFNLKCMETIYDCLEIPFIYTKTKSFDPKPQHVTDGRKLVDHRNELAQDFKPYVQVFDDRYGFIPNLSILDLIFNEGPNALIYMEAQNLRL